MEEKKDVELQAELPIKILPLVALRGKVLFPKTMLNFEVGRPNSVAAIDKAVKENTEVFIASQRSAFIDQPKKNEINRVGVIARIKQVVKIQNTGNMKIMVEAVERAKIQEFLVEKGLFIVSVTSAPYLTEHDPVDIEARLRLAKQSFIEYALSDKRINKETLSAVTEKTDANEFVDNAVSVVNFKEADVQRFWKRTTL